ncbi:hypothetical protein NLI96_g1506 [Meripilus lineatus]|uniref:Uncharacterized protein n=1 Tax=Meripilus lineatus TaxID=2056292 RepID=A0AAD5VAS7_9APHY|nr:hypothetical protein NLI96_g1506 [Physisporinus lineatus]
MPPPPVRTSHPIIPIARANTVLGALPENHSSTLSRRSVLGGPILEAPVGTAPEGNARCAPFPHLSLTIMIIDNEELRPPVSPPLPPRQPPADRPASPKRRFTLRQLDLSVFHLFSSSGSSKQKPSSTQRDWRKTSARPCVTRRNTTPPTSQAQAQALAVGV